MRTRAVVYLLAQYVVKGVSDGQSNIAQNNLQPDANSQDAMHPAAPTVSISLSLTSNTYRRSDNEDAYPRLVVTTNLISPELATVDLRGETDSGTVLGPIFRLEHFEFYDLTESRTVDMSPFPGTCEPRLELQPYQVIELKRRIPLETGTRLDDINPLADPVRLLKAGHEYDITLKPQKVRWVGMSKAELFRAREDIPIEELPEGPLMTLGSEDKLRLKVED